MSRMPRYRSLKASLDALNAPLDDEIVKKLDWSKATQPVDQPKPETRGGTRKRAVNPTPPVQRKYKRAPKKWLSSVQRAMAAKTGELPHQFMLRIMRLGPGGKIGNHELDWDDIKWATMGAAPYYGARMSAISIKPADRPPIIVHLDPEKLKKLSPDELNEMVATIAAAMQKQQQADRLALPPPVVNGLGEIIDVEADEYERTLQ